MLPPSDPLAHHSHKLAEILASLQRQASLPAPPPPYAPNTTRNTSLPIPIPELDEEDVEDEITLAPIVIKIDTSLTIDGQGNTVALPSSTTTTGGASSSNAADVQSPTTTTTTDTNTTDATTPARAILQHLQQQRQTKTTQLAATIIGALKASGVLDDLETGRQRPIELDVNAGIHVKGDSNVVGAKAAAPPPSSTSISNTSPISTSQVSSAGSARDSRSSRKRRAQSEPLEMPSLKKSCPSTEAE